jgi:hypothetical protein
MSSIPRFIHRVYLAGLTMIWLGSAASAHAETGVFADRIVLGQSAALEGPAGALGRDLTMAVYTADAWS